MKGVSLTIASCLLVYFFPTVDCKLVPKTTKLKLWVEASQNPVTQYGESFGSTTAVV